MAAQRPRRLDAPARQLRLDLGHLDHQLGKAVEDLAGRPRKVLLNLEFPACTMVGMRPEDILDAGDVFDANAWPKSDDEYFPGLFESYCRMLACMTVDERRLLLTLTRRYQWIKFSDYTRFFLFAWTRLARAVKAVSNIKTVAVLPLQKRRTRGPKSSDLIFYLARSLQPKLRQVLGAAYKLVLCENTTVFSKYTSGDTAHVLVDDYIGSGDTAITCINGLKSLKPGMLIYAVALAAQEDSVRVLAANNCHVVAGQLLKRGISDNSDLNNKNTARTIMENLERRLHIPKDYRFGWKATEGLVTLLRTPNNTFPAFWTDRLINKQLRWTPAFPRK